MVIISIKIISALILLWVIWGSTFLATKIAIVTIPPFIMAGICFFAAGIIMLFVLMVYSSIVTNPTDRHDINTLKDLQQWKNAAAIAVTLIVGGQGGITWGEQYVSSGIAGLLFSTSALWLALIGHVVFRQRVTKTMILGLLIGFVGLSVLLWPSLTTGVNLFGIVALIIAAISWAFGSLYSGKIESKTTTWSPFLSAGTQMLIGGLVLIVIGITNRELTYLNLSQISFQSFTALLYMISMGALLGFTLFIWILRTTSPFLSNTFTYVSPVLAVLFGWAILGEPVTIEILFASSMIIGAVAIIMISSSRTLGSPKKNSSNQ